MTGENAESQAEEICPVCGNPVSECVCCPECGHVCALDQGEPYCPVCGPAKPGKKASRTAGKTTEGE